MKIILAILILAFSACAIIKSPVSINVKPISVYDFLDTPFGHKESIAEFKKNLPSKTKTQKLIRRTEEQQIPDTIYSFNYKKSKVSVYKTRFNQEFLFVGHVKNSEIELANGVRVSMGKEDFFKAFTDFPESLKDTIRVEHPQKDRAFNFYFNKRGRLTKYTFAGNLPQNREKE